MPAKDGKLTEEEQSRAQEWVREKSSGIPACTMCGQRQWALGDHSVHSPIYFGGGMFLGGPTYPQFMLICQTCGHTVYYNAILSGVIKEKEQEATDQEEENADASD